METFQTSVDAPAVLAGVDVAKERHQVLIDVPGKKRRAITVPNSRSGFSDLVKELKRHGLPVHVALEATGDYHRALASFLHQNGIRLHLASSVATARTREALHNSWDKNDPKDAQVILHLLKSGTVQVFHDPFINGYSDLPELANTYYHAGRRKTVIYNVLMTHYLPVYFPEAEAYMCSSRSPWLIGNGEIILTPPARLK